MSSQFIATLHSKHIFWDSWDNIFCKCDFRAVQRSALCRSQRELSNAYFVAKFGFDTAENEPCKICPIERCRSPTERGLVVRLVDRALGAAPGGGGRRGVDEGLDVVDDARALDVLVGLDGHDEVRRLDIVVVAGPVQRSGLHLGADFRK